MTIRRMTQGQRHHSRTKPSAQGLDVEQARATIDLDTLAS
jgi:hypothetical protein